MRMRPLLSRHARYIRWTAAAMIAVSLALLLRFFPWDRAFIGLSAWIEGRGLWGPLVFIALYLGMTLLLLPGWWLTLLAGAVFGLVWGTVLASAASTLAAAVAFLLARHFARRVVEQRARDSPKFNALDSAIREGGWRIVALVRLSPVFPFGVQNYIYGLTPIGFWTCIVVSWIALLPGTVMYVYLGELTRTAVEPRDTGLVEWLIRGLGLIATMVAIVYITRLARRKLREQTDLNHQPKPEPSSMDAHESPWKIFIFASIALLMLGSSIYAQFHPQVVREFMSSVLRASGVGMVEAFEEKPDGPSFDHSRFHAVLKRVVTDDGMVDYERLWADPADLTAYLNALAEADFDVLGRNEKLALLINAYNAFTLQLILDHWPVASIMDIPEDQRWDAKRWEIGDRTMSLNEIEHEWLRARFIEPRIHFAINCASVGCPPLLDEAYTADRIDEQLERATRIVHVNGSRWFSFDPATGVVSLTKLYDWYGEDFEAVADSPLTYAARYAPALRQALDAGKTPEIQWLEYDWALNRRGVLEQ